MDFKILVRVGAEGGYTADVIDEKAGKGEYYGIYERGDTKAEAIDNLKERLQGLIDLGYPNEEILTIEV